MPACEFSALLELSGGRDYVGGATSFFLAPGSMPTHTIQYEKGALSVQGSSVYHLTAPLVAGRRIVLIFRFSAAQLNPHTSYIGDRLPPLFPASYVPSCCNDTTTTVRAARPLPSHPSSSAVATSHPLASECGKSALECGGTAVDAAIAANLCQSVIEPEMCGPGGDLFVQVWHQGKLHGYNGAGRSPSSLQLARVRQEGLSNDSPLAITVPGAVDGWSWMHRRFGKLSWAALFERAIFIAENGHPPHEVAAAPALADTLRRIAVNGAQSLYQGNLANDIVNAAVKLGSPLSHADMEAHHGEEIEPISTTYRQVPCVGATVQLAGHHCASGAQRARALQSIEPNFPFSRAH